MNRACCPRRSSCRCRSCARRIWATVWRRVGAHVRFSREGFSFCPYASARSAAEQLPGRWEQARKAIAAALVESYAPLLKAGWPLGRRNRARYRADAGPRSGRRGGALHGAGSSFTNLAATKREDRGPLFKISETHERICCTTVAARAAKGQSARSGRPFRGFRSFFGKD